MKSWGVQEASTARSPRVQATQACGSRVILLYGVISVQQFCLILFFNVCGIVIVVILFFFFFFKLKVGR